MTVSEDLSIQLDLVICFVGNGEVLVEDSIVSDAVAIEVGEGGVTVSHGLQVVTAGVPYNGGAIYTKSLQS